MMMNDKPPIRVLSLDGGGMRGTYTATYLDRITATFARRRDVSGLDVGAAFDLIVGTSTGGIVACALAAGVPLTELTKLYAVEGPKIFSRPIPSSLTSAGVDHFAREKALRDGAEALKSALVARLNSETLGQVYERRGIALAVPAVEMSQHRAWVFKTPHFAGTNHRDDNTTLVDVCLATSAAPIYRSLAVVARTDSTAGGHNIFADGGLWANNPVVVGLVEALELAAPGQAIEIFCLGTCPVPAGEQIAPADIHRGLVDWKFGAQVATLSIDAHQFAYDHMARKLGAHMDRRVSVVRFPSDKVPAALVPYLGLDDTRIEAVNALIAQALTDADMTNSRCTRATPDNDDRLICALFESAPVLTYPLINRKTYRS